MARGGEAAGPFSEKLAAQWQGTVAGMQAWCAWWRGSRSTILLITLPLWMACLIALLKVIVFLLKWELLRRRFSVE